MIVSNDSIMKPPYNITNNILKLISSISKKLGEVNSLHIVAPKPQLRKKNRIRTIKASLEIEGNSLTEEQITAIVENKHVFAPEKDILEVKNAIKTYSKINEYNPYSVKSFLFAHKSLMEGLIENPGKLRSKPVGIFKGEEVTHIAPPAKNLQKLMNDLFGYLKDSDDHLLIKSCVAHYEIEFIHPFLYGNGRMGRLWQSLLLLKESNIFEFLPFETLIKERQSEYYSVLEKADKSGESTEFIEFMLNSINDSLEKLLDVQNLNLTTKERVDYFSSVWTGGSFTRKDYMNEFKDISTSTASRDLKYGVENKLFEKVGEKRNTVYRIAN